MRKPINFLFNHTLPHPAPSMMTMKFHPSIHPSVHPILKFWELDGIEWSSIGSHRGGWRKKGGEEEEGRRRSSFIDYAIYPERFCNNALKSLHTGISISIYIYIYICICICICIDSNTLWIIMEESWCALHSTSQYPKPSLLVELQ
ncbi:unnamed protein product [Hymenolepis diminuta]|uniref:Uncharacterized protein n=1 Tax=Hymenolepis diminuta TaxID=6216 RepID=A0A564YNJ2_HYMDI|nr:unnamed protein product [Hymenolepis diminuta]VUZ48851.1 unnamed protein product [Hymenolepis diminuta]